ncbi:MAG: hypothetical protein A2Y81_06280 [Nitrospirae bacterium RBG_13_43_8]|nr:MAG: hypothetical protein A2Y81_06280 [Nitrospirae bacterium RBG_13_43_8]
MSIKALEDKIITELKNLPEEGKKEVLDYIDHLKTKKKEKTLRLLKRTAGKWKGLIDIEKLKRDIYSDRLISTRSRVKF